MYDVAIIGCGVIGAAAAYALSRYDNKVSPSSDEDPLTTTLIRHHEAILRAMFP